LSWRSESEGNGMMEFIEAVEGQRITCRLSLPGFDQGLNNLKRLAQAPRGRSGCDLRRCRASIDGTR